MSSKMIKRLLLLVAILDIGLMIDTNLFFSQEDAAFGSIGGLNVSLTSLCLFGLYAVWLFESVEISCNSVPIRFVGIGALFYLSAILLSGFAAQKPILSLFDLNLIFQAYLLLVYLGNHLASEEDMEFVLSALAIALLMQAGFVLAGQVRGESFSLGPVDVTFDVDRQSHEVYGESEGGVPRSGGSVGSPVLAGSFMALLMVPVSSLLIIPASPRARWLSASAVLLGLPAIMLTGTRGAVITLACAGLIFGGWLFYRKWLPKWILLAALIPASIAAIPFAYIISSRTLSDDGDSATARIHLAKIASRMIADKPLFGVGAGNCHLAMERYANTAEFRHLWFYTIHSKYLLVWVETGIIGLATFLGFLFQSLWLGWAGWRRGSRSFAIVALAFFAAICGHMVHMAVDIFNSRPQVQILWCCVGILVAAWRLGTVPGEPVRPDHLAIPSVGGGLHVA